MRGRRLLYAACMKVCETRVCCRQDEWKPNRKPDDNGKPTPLFESATCGRMAVVAHFLAHLWDRLAYPILTSWRGSQDIGVSQTAKAPLAVQSDEGRRVPLIRFLAYLALIPGLLILGLASAVAGYEFRHAEHVYPGVDLTVATRNGPLEIELGGLTLLEAEGLLTRILTPYPGSDVTLRYGSQEWVIPSADLGIELDARATAEAAYALGRRGTVWKDLLTQLRLYRRGMVIEPVLRYDEGQEAYILARIARTVNQPTQEGVLRLEGLEVVDAPGQPGREMDVAASRAAMRNHLLRGDESPVELIVVEIPPVIGDVALAAAQAQVLLRRSVTLSFQEDTVSFELAVTPEVLADWIAYRPQLDQAGKAQLNAVLDEEKVAIFVAEELAPQVFRESKDGTFRFDSATRTLTPIQVSQEGWEVNVPETTRRLVTALQGEDEGVEISVDRLKPRVATEDADQMGIVELVAQSSTSFKGSSAARVQNIAAAASKFQGIVIPPGDVFSFNRYLGSVSEDNGFVEGLIIWGDRTAVGIGGGVCQVSTTAFRAAFFGGFPIVERWAHGYVVSWYGEPGYDATIYEPQVDFKFRNDTAAYLLIQTDVDTQAGTLTFSFYGTRPNREVEVTDYEVENIRDAPPPVYQEDPALEPGVEKQVEWAKRGMDVTVQRVVREDGEVLREDTFVSQYQPWAAVYLVGPEEEAPAEDDVETTDTEA